MQTIRGFIKKSFAGTAFRIWLLSSFILSLLVFCWLLSKNETYAAPFSALFFLASLVLSTPAFILLIILAPVINRTTIPQQKISRLIWLEFFITLGYGSVAGPFFAFTDRTHFNDVPLLVSAAIAVSCLFLSVLTATHLQLKRVNNFFSAHSTSITETTNNFNLHIQKTTIMESPVNQTDASFSSSSSTLSNRILIKGVITGALILLLLIPAYYITNLVTERQQRQAEVVAEVSNKWATRQILSGPYFTLPYTHTYTNDTGKTYTVKTNLFLFADDLKVSGELFPENRQRSIYKVLLYKSSLKLSGSFKTQWPADINTANIDFANAKLCFGLSDFKGLEEEIKINFNNQQYALSPGLPATGISETGLSVPISLQSETLNTAIPFSLTVKLRGSESLHFLPLAANSRFDLKSKWQHPSFDGNVLPNDHQLSKDGFNAYWTFNRANLPFNMVVLADKFKDDNLDFGVSMVQPADQYDKTMRSIKYAVLFIGLTFAFFFIIELLQKKPFHPVQYILVGLALLIFYTLLLSVSEFILFDYAYAVAALATVTLISLYAKSHFTKWSIAGVFAAALSCLYAFIFVLIRLEDTALLLGSIGLFIILASAMFLSRRIKWYGSDYNSES